jgi:8-oxo-dGTP pyrophosphatase MutT (NUDIX family)
MISFWEGFSKQAEADKVDKEGRKHVAAVAVIHDGKILMGKRRDNGRWTQPGGHLNEGEDPTSGAIRELREEAGMNATTMKHLATEKVITKHGKKYVIHAFKATVKNPSTSMQHDPDQEVHRWVWISFKDGIKKEIMDNLHVPADKNLVFKELGIKGFEEKVAFDVTKALKNLAKRKGESVEKIRSRIQ